MKARWWKWVVGCVGAGGVVLAIGVMRLIEKPAPMSLAEVEAQQIAFFESLAPEGEAATTKLLEAWERMDAISAEWPGAAQGQWEGLVRAFLDFLPMMPRHRLRAVELLETLRPGIDLLIAASEAPRKLEDVWIDANGFVSVQVPGYPYGLRESLGEGMRVLRIELEVAAERGDYDRVIECLDAVLRLALLYQQTPDTIGMMAGEWEMRTAISLSLELAQSGRLSSDACEAIASMFANDDLWHWMLTVHFVEAKRLNELWEEAWRRTDIRQRRAIELAELRLRASLGDELSAFDDGPTYAWLGWTCAQSPDDAKRRIGSYAAQLSTWCTTPFEDRSSPAPSIVDHPYASTQQNLVEQIRASADLLQSRLTGAALALRLVAMKQDGGALPSSLDELDWPEAVCPLTGRLFEYERRTPDATDPRAFVIRIPVTQEELARVAPRMATSIDQWLLVTPAPLPRAEHPSYGNGWLDLPEANE